MHRHKLLDGARIIKNTNIKHEDSIEIGRFMKNLEEKKVVKDKD